MFSFTSFVFFLFICQSFEQQSLPYTFGYRSSYKVHQQGNINLIISAPHGGNTIPSSQVPDRTIGGCLRTNGSNPNICTWFFNDTCTDGIRCNSTTVKDTQSDEFAENVANHLNKTWNYKPFVVIAQWHRRTVDFNREIEEATFNHPEAILAYQGYHNAINQAINQINQTAGRALLIDIHGHAQGNYTMVGYLLSNFHLNRNNLNSLTVISSIDPLCTNLTREQCIRGQNSFGSALENNGLGVSYPSFANPQPGTRTFYSGGFITENYISRISAIQTELPTHIRTSANRTENAKQYAQAIVDYMTDLNLILFV